MLTPFRFVVKLELISMKCLAYEGLFFSLSNCELHLLVLSHVVPAPGTVSSLWHDARSCLYTSEQVPSYLISAGASHPAHSCKAAPSPEGHCRLFKALNRGRGLHVSLKPGTE